MKTMKKAIHDKYKSKAMKYINSNKKYTNIYSDVDINKIGDDCKTLFSNYDDFLIQSNSKYLLFSSIKIEGLKIFFSVLSIFETL